MVHHTKLIVHFATLKLILQSASPSHLKTRKLENDLRPLWKALSTKLRELFPEADDTGTFIVPALNVRSQVLSIKDRRIGVGKPVFKLASFGNGQLFDLVISHSSHLARSRTANV